MERKSYLSLERKLADYLKAELVTRDWGYADLARKMKKYHQNRSERAILQKLSRKAFSASFFVAALMALEIPSLDIETVLMARPLDKRRKTEPTQRTKGKTKKNKPVAATRLKKVHKLPVDDKLRSAGKVYPRNWNGPSW